MTAKNPKVAWSEEAIRALGVRMPSRTACEIVYGTARTLSYQLIKSGKLDFKVIKVPGSNRYVTPTSEVLRVLGLDGES